MGIVRQSVLFDGNVPDLEDLRAAITRISGLSVIVVRTLTDDLHEWDVRIAFECEADYFVEVCAYRRGAVQQFLDEDIGEAEQMLFKGHVEGANEPAGKQGVYVQAHMGQEPTLYATTVLALESLGGTTARSLPDELRQEYGKVVSEVELHERVRDAKRQMRRVKWWAALLMPIFIPIWFAGGVLAVMTLPFRVYKAARVVKDAKRRRNA